MLRPAHLLALLAAALPGAAPAAGQEAALRLDRFPAPQIGDVRLVEESRRTRGALTLQRGDGPREERRLEGELRVRYRERLLQVDREQVVRLERDYLELSRGDEATALRWEPGQARAGWEQQPPEYQRLPGPPLDPALEQLLAEQGGAGAACPMFPRLRPPRWYPWPSTPLEPGARWSVALLDAADLVGLPGSDVRAEGSRAEGTLTAGAEGQVQVTLSLQLLLERYQALPCPEPLVCEARLTLLRPRDPEARGPYRARWSVRLRGTASGVPPGSQELQRLEVDLEEAVELSQELQPDR